MAKVILIIAAIIEFVFRGLPAFFGSQAIANLFGVDYIEAALVYVHPFGAVMLVLGVMFFIASKDPPKYKILVDLGILRFALGFVAHLITLFMLGTLPTFFWIHMVIDLVLLILFIVVRPKEAKAAAA
jgi:hypothetical protein